MVGKCPRITLKANKSIQNCNFLQFMGYFLTKIDLLWIEIKNCGHDWCELPKICYLSKNIHNFLKNCPQAMLAYSRLFPCLEMDLKGVWNVSGECLVFFCLSKNIHNFLKNCPQALLTCLRLFPCLMF